MLELQRINENYNDAINLKPQFLTIMLRLDGCLRVKILITDEEVLLGYQGESTYFSIIIFFALMESVQLKNIQNIENSLHLLKSKIEKMAKLDAQNQNTMHRLIDSTIPVVDKKLKDSQLHQDMKIKKSQYLERSHEKRKKNQESRLVNEKEAARSKELLTLMKHHNSLHLKQSKKINQEKVQKIKELQLNQKKSKKDSVRRKQQESQARIQEFHQQKQNDLRLRRECEEKENEVRINKLLHKMKQLEKKEMEMEEKVKTSQEKVNNFRTMIKKVDKMKSAEFLKFKESITPTNALVNSKSISEAILLFASRNNAQVD